MLFEFHIFKNINQNSIFSFLIKKKKKKLKWKVGSRGKYFFFPSRTGALISKALIFFLQLANSSKCVWRHPWPVWYRNTNFSLRLRRITKILPLVDSACYPKHYPRGYPGWRNEGKWLFSKNRWRHFTLQKKCHYYRKSVYKFFIFFPRVFAESFSFRWYPSAYFLFFLTNTSRIFLFCWLFLVAL